MGFARVAPATALEEIRRTWTGAKWLIEVDVRGFFDNIDHDILLSLLARRIDDPVFIDLIGTMLKAGCMDEWKFERTYSGTPQGGVISPLLANIYLHELDLFMEEMRARFDKGVKRRANPAYVVQSQKIAALRKEIDAIRAVGADEAEVRTRLARIEAINRDRRKISSVDQMDPNFRRLRYCRYADDFLVGVIGSKADAVRIMADIQHFLADRLNLTVSPEKTGVRDASRDRRSLASTYAPSRCALPEQWRGDRRSAAGCDASFVGQRGGISSCGCRGIGSMRSAGAKSSATST
jgi:RNA-directed DNA polymerase